MVELRAVDPEAVKYEFIRLLIEQGVEDQDFTKTALRDIGL